MDAATLLEQAVQRGVAFTPGNAFFVDGGGEHTLRLSFSGIPVARSTKASSGWPRRFARRSGSPSAPARVAEPPAVPLV